MAQRWLAPATLLLAVVIIATGLAYTLYENLSVAAHAVAGESGRLHPHTKNTTRLAGDPAAVRALVARAVFLDEAATAQPLAEDWRDAIREHVESAAAPTHAVVLPGDDEAAAFAMPGAFWAAYAAVPVAFARRDAIDDDEFARIAGLGLPLFVLAPASAISDAVVERLRAIGQVRRVAGATPASHAVAIATYRDNAAGFGWGRRGGDRDGYYHFVLATPDETRHALAALPLARSNAAAFLFAGDDGGLPAETDRYLWTLRAPWAVTPSEGPFHHLWVVGDRTSYAAQARADLSVEKSDYLARGPVALGPLDGLSVVWIALGIASSLFVTVHSGRLLPELMPVTRFGWAGAALLLPLLGPVLYLASFRRPMTRGEGGMAMWHRPPAIQAAAATAVAFGYGAPFMIAIGFLFAWLGFPLFFGEFARDGWAFLLGAGMPIMMFAMWAGAILVAWLAVQYPMRRMTGDDSPLRSALGVTVLSMSAVSLGMMTVGWILMMEKAQMMPHEDEILWFGAMWLASFVGFLVAWPLNSAMVRTGLKSGAM